MELPYVPSVIGKPILMEIGKKMARKRIIDPEFWSDEEIGQWSYEARLFYIGLWNFADDVGRFKAHPQLLKSQIFPYDQKFNIENLKKELNHKIQWYEVDSLQYGFIRNFLKHQRIDKPSDSKLPKPPLFVDNSSNNQGTLPPNIREVNISKEKRSAGAPPLSDIDFLKALKDNPAYKHINIDIELNKMDAYLLTHKGRQKTRRFIVGWLNRIDRPLQATPQRRAEPVDTRPPDPAERAKVQKLIQETLKGNAVNAISGEQKRGVRTI
jgi:hypothetical protein